MPDLHDQIADLEAEIEELSEAAVRCRKVITAAKVAVAAGVLLLAIIMLGVVRFDPVVLVGAITAILGGIALSGSNRTTLDEIVAGIRVRHAYRAEMIDRLGLRVVGSEVVG
jgi:hypothetical protein